MFAKLLKHEWKATSGLLSILSLCALGAGVLGAVLMRILNSAASQQLGGAMEGVLAMMMTFVIIALVAYVIGAQILLLRRYYKNKFTDEGYLTFTLPAKSWEIFLSSLVNTLVWMAIVVVVMFLAILIMMLVGMGEYISESAEYYTSITTDMETSGVWDNFGISALSSVVSFISGTTLILTCITMGATLAKKHKILSAIALYYGLSMVQSTLSTVLTGVMVAGTYATDEAITALQSAYLIQIAVQALLAVGGFFLSTHLMTKKLNLP